MDSTVVYLPFKTTVNVHAFTNAAYRQQITFTPESGSTIGPFTGLGENDTPIGQGQFITPSSGKSSRGFQVTVTTMSNDGSGWQPSQVGQAACAVWYYSVILVVSEDFVDQDWNDAVAMFSWWAPPSQRQAPEVSMKGSGLAP